MQKPNDDQNQINKAYSIINKFYNDLVIANKDQSKLDICYKYAFTCSADLSQIVKTNYNLVNDSIELMIAIIKEFRMAVLLPFLAHYEELFLPLLKSDVEFKNIINDCYDHNVEDYQKWVIEIMKSTAQVTTQLLKLNH